MSLHDQAQPWHEHESNVSTTACPACLADGKNRRERMERGWSATDAWGMNTYVAGVIGGMARFLSENLNGCPSRLCEDGDVDAGCEKWRAILVEIATGFELVTADDGPVGEPRPPELDRSFALLSEWWEDLWD